MPCTCADEGFSIRSVEVLMSWTRCFTSLVGAGDVGGGGVEHVTSDMTILVLEFNCWCVVFFFFLVEPAIQVKAQFTMAVSHAFLKINII